MIAFAKMAIIYLIVFERVWLPPAAVQDNPFVRNLIAWVAQDLELYEYPECKTLWKARDAYEQSRSCRGRIADIQKFFFVDFGVEGSTCYMIWILKYNRPFEELCRRRILESYGESRDFWISVHRQNDQIYHIYDLLDDMHRSIPLYCKRLKLDRLRQLLGDEAYEAGWFPNPTPTWRFLP